MAISTTIKPVIVLGAGPVGMSAALELGRCNIPVIIIERNRSTSIHPKTRNYNTRTMEIARGWGTQVYEDLRQLDLPPQWKSTIRFLSKITGFETGFIESKGFMGAGPLLSPVNSVLSSQDKIEPVMLNEIKRNGASKVLFAHEMVEFVSGDSPIDQEVIVRIKNRDTGEESTITGSAMIAADGAASGMRKRLKVEMEGKFKIAHFITCYFKADIERHVKDPGILLFVGNNKTNGVFQPLDAKGRWLAQINVKEKEWDVDKFTEERCIAWIRESVGIKDLPVDVKSIGKWQMNAAVCNQFLKGRVFLMGDAASMFPPTGGLGVNTGIQGMHNAIWKLALFLQGKAGRGLLTTYETERRPVAKRVTEQSYDNALQVAQIAMISRLRERVKSDSLARLIVKAAALLSGRATALTPENVIQATRRYGNQLGLELGTIYDSNAIIQDGSAPLQLQDSYTDYEPTGRPGHRAPHVWLKNKSGTQISTLDLWHPEFTVLVGRKGELWMPDIKEARQQCQLEIPLHVIDGDELIDIESTFLQRYGIAQDGAVLVRPDGYIAWRKTSYNADGPSLADALQSILSNPK